MLRSGNPALGDKTFRSYMVVEPGSRVMTLQGAVNKSIIMLAIVVGVAALAWNYVSTTIDPGMAYPYAIGAMILGLILALVIIFKQTTAPYLAPLYGAVEGVFLGILSYFFESVYPGIVMQAVGLTFGIFFALLIVYKSRLIPVTQNFKLGIAAATGGIFLVYLVSFVLRLFGFGVPYVHGSGIIGIGFSLFVVVIASLNLVLDFDFIENGAESGAPKHMEWYAAFGLTVTLVWLYIEILRLLSKLRER
jgi:uncharacterized YccA/Bax inhibitor family protein